MSHTTPESPDASSTSRRSSGSRAAKWLLFAVPVAGILAGAFWILNSPSTSRLRHDAQVALARGDLPRAERLGYRLMERDGQRTAGMLIVGEALSRAGHYEQVVEFLAQLPEDDPQSAAGHFLRGEIFREHLRHLRDAEFCFRRVLELDPQHIGGHDRMAYLLGMQGRSWDAERHRLELIRHNEFNPAHLALLALATTAEENPGEIELFLRTVPGDPSALCGIARAAMRQGDIARALQILRAIVAADPNLLQAQAWLGELLSQQEKPDEFVKWEAALPERAGEHPEVWHARGLGAQREGNRKVAARCFWECVRRDPNSQAGNYQLGQELTTLERPEQAVPFLTRARLLGELIRAGKLFEISATIETMRSAARLCDELGLHWEAWGWRQFLFQAGKLPETDPLLANGVVPPFNPTRHVEAEYFANLRRRFDELCVGRTDKARLPADTIDLSSFPLPTGTRQGVETALAATTIARKNAEGAVTFRDLAADVGIGFQFHNANRAGQPLDYMYKFSGGGVAVIDMDGDLWPDLYYTQGTDWPPRAGQRDFLDRLYRNLGNGRFADVTETCGIVEDRFSQGVTVGDIDSDGFSDLYVANIGKNRLYRNNGDGTFTELDELNSIDNGAWTTSCVIADFNGDTHPDIYCVNYLEGAGIFERPCRGRDEASRACTPQEYKAADDQLILNLGDGRFQDVSREAGILVPDGKGLGVVAADFDGTGRLSLFIANDAVPNFLFVNQTAAAGGIPRLDERGFISGTAVDADGQAQACMGIAAGDADGDGLLDLFVTNFYRESNTLYRRQPGLLFHDATREAGLHEPSFDMLGFGTQFLDGDLDGLPDLVVANGHVSRLTYAGQPFEMRPQFFRNAGAGRFVELQGSQAGPYFHRKLLGRGLARLDWNRDGREDFAVTHLETPAALVTNETSAAGHFLALRLCGVASPRDAIGATVSIRVGDKRHMQQLTAGDGYQASNERRLVFGLRDSTSIDALEIRWPSGETQRFQNLPADTEWQFVENRKLPVPPANGGR